MIGTLKNISPADNAPDSYRDNAEIISENQRYLREIKISENKRN